jgi:Bacterial protein of unknown function (DUF839)
MRARFVLVCAALLAAALAATLAGPASGRHDRGFKTQQSRMLDLGPDAPSGSSVEALLTVGERIPGTSYRFESIPDGISVSKRWGFADVLVNHETSTVPFPYNPAVGGTDPGESQNDFDNAQVSRLALHRKSAAFLAGRLVIRSAENFQRFCSNFLATWREGFDRPTLFTNEEAQDWVFRSGTAWPGPSFIAPGTSGAEQAGVVVAYDVWSGERRPIYGMGRHNHENSMAVPGYRDVVVLSGDDTFSTNPASSQLYLYVADNRRALWRDRGTLYAFSIDDPNKNDYFDIQPGDAPVQGTFIEVPKDIARGKSSEDGHELTVAGDFPDFVTTTRPSGTPDGPQWVLDQWGNKENNRHERDVFDFIRIEDTAYDKRRGLSNVVYMADSGRATSGAANPATTSTNGRIWKLEFDRNDPTKANLSVLVQGDDNPVKTPGEIHQPDNMETTRDGTLLVQEDPSTANQFTSADTVNRTAARIWQVDLTTFNPAVPDSAVKGVVAVVNQGLDENTNPSRGAVDVDPPDETAGDTPPFAPGAFPISPGNLGAWESSGIVDASSVFGKGAFLVTVQAHTYWVESAPGFDLVAPFGAPDFTKKREGGQLLLLRLGSKHGRDD